MPTCRPCCVLQELFRPLVGVPQVPECEAQHDVAALGRPDDVVQACKLARVIRGKGLGQSDVEHPGADHRQAQRLQGGSRKQGIATVVTSGLNRSGLAGLKAAERLLVRLRASLCRLVLLPIAA